MRSCAHRRHRGGSRHRQDPPLRVRLSRKDDPSTSRWRMGRPEASLPSYVAQLCDRLAGAHRPASVGQARATCERPQAGRAERNRTGGDPHPLRRAARSESRARAGTSRRTADPRARPSRSRRHPARERGSTGSNLRDRRPGGSHEDRNREHRRTRSRRRASAKGQARQGRTPARSRPAVRSREDGPRKPRGIPQRRRGGLRLQRASGVQHPETARRLQSVGIGRFLARRDRRATADRAACSSPGRRSFPATTCSSSPLPGPETAKAATSTPRRPARQRFRSNTTSTLRCS